MTSPHNKKKPITDRCQLRLTCRWHELEQAETLSFHDFDRNPPSVVLVVVADWNILNISVSHPIYVGLIAFTPIG